MDLLIFDLDGTLIDSKLDLAQAVNATRAHFGLPPLDLETVGNYIGNGAPVLIRRAMGAERSQADVDKALEFFLAYYGDHKLDNTRAYPGIPEALEALHQASVLMAVLTNKPVRISGRIIEGLGLSKYFLHVYGGNSFERKKPDPLGVETLLAETGVPKDRAMVVGDSAVDVQTARNAGVKVCGVTYGFQPESFVTDPPDMIVNRPEELARAVIAERKSRGVIES
ncbi:MAG TPA: HAD-IA family hydrolase [Bryobacteraceae bacterium]|nr:HAD-IA family hydrolase [Bryobacteraceae bacterium]